MDVSQSALSIPTNQIRDHLGERCQKLFQDFLEEYMQGDELKYQADVSELIRPERNTLVVSFADVEKYNHQLANTILQEYYRVYPYLCLSVKHFAQNKEVEAKKEFYISFIDVPSTLKVRELRTGRVGSLIRITGQVVRTHPVHPELVSATFVCLECQTVIRDVQQQFKYTQPTICRNPACNNRKNFLLDIAKSKFVDFQKVRIQETQGELPRGSIPRSIEVILRAEAVETAQAGDRCDFTGTLIVVPDVSVMSFPGVKAESGSRLQSRGDQVEGLKGLKALGVRDLTYKLAFLACTVNTSFKKYGGLNPNKEEMTPELMKKQMSDAEWNMIYNMSQDQNLYQNLCSSLFPAIYGNDEVKKGILLMLFGGVPKSTTEDTRLRGDINVCIVGDPSTAKSQLLKLVEGFSPRAVYTSGKASTAAGLTAAVVKDEESHEFVIEAGALMLSDSGVCCIDEFDKMDPKDQVAIHEAMEQQTISITKAGIRATLNARTSILAAANPVGGRYDKSRSLRQNVSMTAPIMSRFDLFFVLVDECNEIADYDIARRIVSLHRNSEETIDRIYNLEDVQKYITFARIFKPRIARSSVELMVSYYKEMRLKDQGASGTSSWRVTARQLESIIRLSEALARMHFQNEVHPRHVEEAYHLLSKSIIRVEQPDICLEEELFLGAGHLANTIGDEERTTETRKEGSGLKLSYEQYRHMANLLILHLKREAEHSDVGVRMSSLVDWYLQEMEDEIDTEAELIARKSLVEKVINRLIDNDNIIIKLTQTGLKHGDTVKEEDPILVLYPNYMLEF